MRNLFDVQINQIYYFGELVERLAWHFVDE